MTYSGKSILSRQYSFEKENISAHEQCSHTVTKEMSKFAFSLIG